jgi:hypothetical protein
MPFNAKLLDVVNTQWDFFGKDLAGHDIKIDGVNKEAVGKFKDRVGDYWLAIPPADLADLIKSTPKAKALGRMDGSINVPWSAAFISFCMKTGGAAAAFPYSAGHATWIKISIKNKLAGRLTANLVGLRPGEEPVEVGDLIGYTRDTEIDVTYDNAPTIGFFSSHSDIVVDVDRARGRLHTIGGNVSQSVARKTLSVAADGRLADIPDKCIVHIRNNIEANTPVV